MKKQGVVLLPAPDELNNILQMKTTLIQGINLGLVPIVAMIIN